MKHFLEQSADVTYTPVDISGNVLQQLEEDLNQAYRGYQADKEKFVENTAVSNVIYSTANVNSVKITDMNSSDDSSEVIEGAPCIALSLQARVVGDVDNLVAFITQLNDEFIVHECCDTVAGAK